MGDFSKEKRVRSYKCRLCGDEFLPEDLIYGGVITFINTFGITEANHLLVQDSRICKGCGIFYGMVMDDFCTSVLSRSIQDYMSSSNIKELVKDPSWGIQVVTNFIQHFSKTLHHLPEWYGKAHNTEVKYVHEISAVVSHILQEVADSLHKIIIDKSPKPLQKAYDSAQGGLAENAPQDRESYSNSLSEGSIEPEPVRPTEEYPEDPFEDDTTPDYSYREEESEEDHPTGSI